jgi:hypothetical protein
MDKANVVFLPHVGVCGGAGRYIQDLSKFLNKKYSIEFFGTFAMEYGSGYSVVLPKLLNGVVFPNYSGVKSITKFLICALSVVKLLILLPFIKKNNYIKDVFILTSGIQILALPYLKRRFPLSTFIVLIQENWLLENGFYGYISKSILNKFDLIISITDTWTSYASKHGLKSLVFKNQFSINSDFNKINHKFDIVYLGGEQRIKGFDTLLDFFGEYSKTDKIHICLLGELSKSNYLKVDFINGTALNDSKIHTFGFVENVNEYIASSRILFIPITDPHFCRPAIEAGLLNKTFLIRRLENLDEFALDGYNCLMFNNTDDAISKYRAIFSNEGKLHSLQMNNQKLSMGFIEDNKNEKLLLEFISNAMSKLT